MRIGWVTGPNFLVDRLQLMQQASVMHPSGISQAIALSVLETLGKEGLEAHLRKVCDTYKERRDRFCSLATKHLKGLAEWSVPEAGMFIWFKLNGVDDSMSLIQKKALEAKVLLVPGSAFSPNEEPSPYVRASFSTATYEEMDLALSRLAEILKRK